MIESTVRRTVELDTSADELWHLLTDASELGSWLGGTIDLPVEAGRSGTFTDADGVVRRIAVDAVEAGRLVAFTWWVDGDESSASTVSFTIDGDDASSALVVEERPVALAGGRLCQASFGDPWGDRLLGLELAVLARGLLVSA